MRPEDSTGSTGTDPGSGPEEGDQEPALRRHEIHIPFVTFFRILAAILFAIVAYRLWPLFQLVLLSILLAVTLNSLVQWLMKKGLKRRGSVTLVLSSVLTVIILGGALFLPIMVGQIGAFSEHLPEFRDHLLSQFAPGTFFHQTLVKAFEGPALADFDTWLGRFLTLGGIAFTGVTQLVLLVMIALYFVVDGGRTYRWFLAFSPH